MDIKVTQIVDNPDGSATVHFDLDEEAKEAMLRYGILQALLNSVSEVEVEEVKE
jgi:hypothetical protein